MLCSTAIEARGQTSLTAAMSTAVKTVGESAATILTPAVEQCTRARSTWDSDMPLSEGDIFTRLVRPRLGARYNELLHTFHLKAYAFDDTVIMSGANLSNDYFTDRQDRYWVFRCRALADFYHELVDALRAASHPHDCGPRTADEPFLPLSHYADLQTRIRKLIGHDAARGRLLSEKGEPGK